MESVELRDGLRVEIRPVTPEDREALRRGFDRLGEDSRYKRFLSPVDRLTDAQLDYLTDLDHHDHEALGAVEEGVMVGVARYVRPEHDAPRAEVAVAVVDDWQGRGLGGLLLDRIRARAREDGVRTFTAAALAENRTVIDLLKGLGSTSTRSGGGGQVDLEIELEGEDELRELMRHAASGVMRFLERIRTWPPARSRP